MCETHPSCDGVGSALCYFQHADFYLGNQLFSNSVLINARLIFFSSRFVIGCKQLCFNASQPVLAELYVYCKHNQLDALGSG